MAKQPLTIQRLIFLFILVAVFLYTYLADLNIFAAVVESLSFASPYVEHFMMLFLILSFASLSVYYYLKQVSNRQISQRFLWWLKIIAIAFFAGFVLSALIIYFNIYCNKTFDT
ncbi:MAG: hypothetical protein H6754_05580 [Candidatus Omnitrophica bacterium]|nr:hypothetical protein [Candidatus Omnitrophota bacterium]